MQVKHCVFLETIYVLGRAKVLGECEHKENCAIGLEEGGAALDVLHEVEVDALRLHVPVRCGALRPTHAWFHNTVVWLDHPVGIHDNLRLGFRVEIRLGLVVKGRRGPISVS